jgi:hypothetical protein
VIEALNVTCDSVACKCAVDRNCPSDTSLNELGQIAQMDRPQAKRKLKELICNKARFSSVFVGKIVAKKLLNGFILLRVLIKDDLRSSQPNGKLHI